jgi:hypothetical protein
MPKLTFSDEFIPALTRGLGESAYDYEKKPTEEEVEAAFRSAFTDCKAYDGKPYVEVFFAFDKIPGGHRVKLHDSYLKHDEPSYSPDTMDRETLWGEIERLRRKAQQRQRGSFGFESERASFIRKIERLADEATALIDHAETVGLDFDADVTRTLFAARTNDLAALLRSIQTS